MNKEAKILLSIAAVVIVVLVVVGILFGNTTTKDKADPDRLVTADSPTQPATGEEKVVLVEFSDFQCPFCAQVEPTIQNLRQTYGENLTFVYRYFPLRNHPAGELAALAAAAADQQGKFWEMHDLLFAKQSDWGDLEQPLAPDLVRQKFIEYATELQLDVDKFTQDLDNKTGQTQVSTGRADGNAINISGTPTFFVNGYETDNGDLEAAIQAELK